MNMLEKEFKDFLAHLSIKTVIKLFGVIGLLVFFNSFFNPFVWDDIEYIVNAPETHSLNPLILFGNNIFNNANQYRAITITYFSILYNIFGTNQFFYHILQFGMHVATSVLVYMLFTLFLSAPISLFLSLIFLVHPMQIESVSYIASSGGNLVMAFGLTALLLSIKEKNGKFITFLQYVLLLLAMLAKETGVLFLFIFVFYDILWKRSRVLKKIIYSSGIFGIYLLLRFTLGHVSLSNRPMIPIAQLSLLERFLTMLKIFWYYIQTFFYPVTLAVNQQWVVKNISFNNFFLPLLLDIFFFGIILCFGFFIYKNHKKSFFPFLLFFIWFLIGMGIHSQLVPLDATVADKWFYFDMVGLLGMIGIIFQNLPLFQTKRVFPFIGVLIIVLLGIRTIVRHTDWQTPSKLFSQAIQVDDNYMSEEQLAASYIYEGKFKNALLPAQKAAKMFPSDTTYYNLGFVYENLGDKGKATDLYVQALQQEDFLPWAHKHYLAVYVRAARMLTSEGKYKDAEKIIAFGFSDYPGAAQLLFLRAANEYKLGNLDAAKKDAEKAVLLTPSNVDYQNFYQRLLHNELIELQ